MIYGILFALLALCLACFREGVWTKYTAQDVARWQAEAAQAARVPAQFHPTHPPLPSSQGQVAHKPRQHLLASQPKALELVA